MPQTMDVEAANRTHPTTRVLPAEEEKAEQARHRMKVVAIGALAGVGALALAGGLFYAYRAGWIGWSTPRSRARRALDAVGGAGRVAYDAVGGAGRRAFDAADGAWQKIKSA